MNEKIIVLGKNFLTPLGIIRSLGAAGYSTDLIYVAGKKGDALIAGSSRYVNDVVEIIGRDDEAIIHLLLERYQSESTSCLLFPTDDYTSSLIDRYREVLEDRFRMPYIQEGESGAVTKLMDKSVQADLAEKAGLRVAKSWEISLGEENISIPADVTYPCICKPQVSARGYKSEIKKCDNRDSLYQMLLALRSKNKNRSVIVQEYLDVLNEYSISAVCNSDEVLLPALIKKEQVARHNPGVTLCGEIEDISLMPEVENFVVPLLKSLRYVGMIDIELFETDRGIYFNELNLRCNGVGYAVMLAGVNLPQKFVQAVMDHKSLFTDDVVVPQKIRFVNDKVLWEDYQCCFLTTKQFKTLSSETEWSLLSGLGEDPEPGKVFLQGKKYQTQKIRIKKKLKKMMKR